MLDTDTKRRIDSCRDILVGKVPDPKSQVEQITIALIYKFMDDMDAQSEEFGGKRSFFVNGFEKYSWSKLLAPTMGGQDTLNLYSEAIGKMTENTHLPALFRDIFKNAYLPYRDPETLKAFLKEIDGFSYDHSERLGDAFEYLLSVLGSQGDAGQFRTPRHIIDFIVRVINPQKHERILDPACGTAGFLISAWKYILDQNKAHKPGDKLTPDERNKLAANIHGYDISPDMVRLSLVNLYLHGFTNPHVDEYDTLTSEDKWNERADVILANPPFMSPKGGIKPHKRFSIQATRSEVLFVDYIHEHLSPNGRAGIIVPEGIIFQSGTAYKALRKLLVQNSLVAVVSLPAGVFQPYSGVKTSILILDKRLAKQTDKVLFVKVGNDGFALGAQRRPIEQDDLPLAEQALKSFFAIPGVFEGNELAHSVTREQIAENADWSFSGDRYRQDTERSRHWPMVSLGDETLFRIESGGTPKSDEPAYWNGGVAWATLVDLPQSDFITQLTGTERTISEEGLNNSSAKLLPIGTILVSSRATIGRVAIARMPTATNQGFKNIIIQDSNRALPEFVACMMKALTPQLEGLATGGTFKEFSKTALCGIEIPLPPIEIQREIIAEIDSYQNVIDGARKVLESYKPRIAVRVEWPLVSIGELCKPEYGFTASAQEAGSHRFIRITDIDSDGRLSESDARYIDLSDEASKYALQKGDVLVARTGATYGKTMLYEEDAPAIFASYLIRLRLPSDRILPKYYWAFSQSENYWVQARRLVSGGGQPQFNGNVLVNIMVPIPPRIEDQKSIVDEIERDLELVNANRELISRFEIKIKAAIDRVWVS
ncbi:MULTISPECIES: N-6 DNA methylase [Pandoraea]|uniref:N-6 DNA methylase n=1 Tax=Pandoraea TaxID=93217 RepID=UPI001F5D8543|nr:MULTISPECIES: N-6 DNA methylase [Pandoraea]MCI3204834.1 restriction endonuclease subunit S [Pandoraea sp. LA3]MDN4582862.1 restriction endonuclease subunit S [Pandoraea capi]